MKTTAGILFASQAALAELQGVKLPAKTSYQLARAMRRFADDIKTLDEKRVALIKELGVEQEDGSYALAPGTTGFDEFMKQFQEMADVEVSFTDVEPISVAAMGDAEIKPATLVQLDWMIKD